MNSVHAAIAGRSRWRGFLLIGIVLLLCGIGAIMLPAVSSLAGSLVLGAVLVVSGVVKIVKARQLDAWAGSARQFLVGAIELIGGILIALDPLKGAAGIALVIAVVFAVQGITQLGLALKVRGQPGWNWLVVAGVIALCASLALVLKLRYTLVYTPDIVAGISLLVGGVAYIAIALATRRAGE